MCPGTPSPVGAMVRRSQYSQGTVTIVAWPAYELRHICNVHIDTKFATRPLWATAAPTRAPTAGAAVGMLKMLKMLVPRGAVVRRPAAAAAIAGSERQVAAARAGVGP
jgi:hypothetical protein